MNVLQVNKFLWQFGGPERVMFELTDLLRQQGHFVEFFGTQHERNVASANSEYFVRGLDYRSRVAGDRAATLLRAAQQTIYSRESRRKLRSLLLAHHYDVAHVHLIEHHISPSVLPELREQGVAVVHTCHDHKLVCPESHLFSQRVGEVCERCVDSRAYHNVIRRRCMRGSLSVSALAGVAQYLHRWMRVYERNVDLFVAPSVFLAERLVRGGIPEHKIRVLPNGLNLSRYNPSGADDGYVLYLGRIAVEKGLPTLVRAAALVPRLRFKVAGEGPARPQVESMIDELGVENVKLLGRMDGARLRELVDRASVVVLTSECHENCPMAVLEAFAHAKPVVATRVGGVPEIVEDGVSGCLVQAGNAEELAAALDGLTSRPRLLASMGASARRRAEGLSENFLAGMLHVYEEARALRGCRTGSPQTANPPT